MKVVALVGSYRKGRIIDSAVAALLEGAASKGALTEKVYLIDKRIEFCRNCRECTQTPGREPGKCYHRDDMESLIQTCLAADILILASPVNMGAATAVTKRFLERLVPFAYWPYGRPAPSMRRTPDASRRAVIVSSSAAPAFVARIPWYGARPVLEYIAEILGVRVAKRLHYGLAAFRKDTALPEKRIRQAFVLGERLVSK